MAIEGAIDACRLFISRLSSQLDELLLKRYPGDHPGPKQWLEILSGMVDTAKAYLDKAEDKSVSATDAQALIRDANRLALISYRYMIMASGTGLDELPYPVVLPLQRWFSQPRLTNSTMFRAELVANYEIRTVEKSEFERFRDPSPRLVEALKISWPIKRITVPSRALGMLPHFAIVAHEIGHAIFHLVSWDFRAHSSDYNSMLGRISTGTGHPSLPLPLSIFVQDVYYNWLQEIVSDAFGLLLAGPSFFFALGGFLQAAGGGLGIGETHPANEIRLDILYRKLVGEPGNSFSEVYEKHAREPLSRDINTQLLPRLPTKTQLVNDLIKILPLYSGIKSGKNIPVSHKAVVLTEMGDYLLIIADKIYDQAEHFLKTTCPEAIYTADKFNRDIDEHLEPLIQAIPPIETGKTLHQKRPTEFSTIINVGWVVLLSRLNELSVKTTDKSNKAEKAEKLHSLLLKAVELSEARRAWEAAT